MPIYGRATRSAAQPPLALHGSVPGRASGYRNCQAQKDDIYTVGTSKIIVFFKPTHTKSDPFLRRVKMHGSDCLDGFAS